MSGGNQPMNADAFVFLDRDGTINRDVGYVHRIADWELLPGVVTGLQLPAECGL